MKQEVKELFKNMWQLWKSTVYVIGLIAFLILLLERCF